MNLAHMNIEQWFDYESCNRLCWLLFHSLWIVALFALSARLVVSFVPANCVRLQSIVYQAALLLALAVLPFSILLPVVDLGSSPIVAQSSNDEELDSLKGSKFPQPEPSSTGILQETSTESIRASSDQSSDQRVLQIPTSSSSTSSSSIEQAASTATIAQRNSLIVAAIIGCYLLGVLFMSARLLNGLLQSKKSVRGGRECKVGTYSRIVTRLAKHWRLRRIPRVVIIDATSTPFVTGLIRPIVVIPASLTTGMTPDQIELLLAHELAHIKRGDLMMNLIQRIAETLLFFNPGIWFLSRRISVLREYVCDQQASQLSISSERDPQLAYAQSLIALLECMPSEKRTDSLAVLRVASKTPSELRRRVSYILGEPMNHSRLGNRLTASIAIVAVLLLLLSPIAFANRNLLSGREINSLRETISTGEINDRIIETLDQAKDAAQETKPSSGDTENDQQPLSTFSQAEKAIDDGPVLKGRVTDRKGNAIEGVQVTLYGGIATRFRGQQTKTNQNGEYEFSPLETGGRIFDEDGTGSHYIGVTFTHPEHVPADGKSWRDIQVSSKVSNVATLDIVMTQGGILSGKITDDQTGEPAKSLSIRILGGKENHDFESNDFLVYTTTNHKGEFITEPVAPGRYVIETNDSDFRDGQYIRMGTVEIQAGDEKQIDLETKDSPQLIDPFQILGEAIGEDGESMIYGGVSVRLKEDTKPIRSEGGGIDGRNRFRLQFGPVDRLEITDNTPYGVGVHDVEIVGANSRKGYVLVGRSPSEPLRITDDPTQPELEDGIRYIRPGHPISFRLIYRKQAPNEQTAIDQEQPNVKNEQDTEQREEAKANSAIDGNRLLKEILNVAPKVGEVLPADDDILWGETVDGLTLGIKSASHAKSASRFHQGDWIRYEVWVRNDSDKTIKIPRDPRDHFLPGKTRDGKIDLLGHGSFLSFSLPLEVIESNALVLKSGESAIYATPQTLIDEPESKRGKFGPTPIRCKPGEYDCYASADLYYQTLGEDSTGKTTKLSSKVTEVSVVAASPFRLVAASIVTPANAGEIQGDAKRLLREWRDTNDEESLILINLAAEVLVDHEQISITSPMPTNLGNDRLSISTKMNELAIQYLIRYADSIPETSARWREARVAILWKDELIGLLSLDEIRETILDGKPFELSFALPRETLQQLENLIKEGN